MGKAATIWMIACRREIDDQPVLLHPPGADPRIYLGAPAPINST